MEKSNYKSEKLNFRTLFTTNNAFWFEKNLEEKNREFKAKIPVKFDLDSTRKTIEWLKRQKQSWVVYQKEIEAALKYKHYWPSVLSNDKIIGCIKIGFENVYIFDYNKVVKFPERMAFIYDTYVLDNYRNKDVGKYMISQANKFLKSRGYNKVGCHIPPWNKPSINAFEKNGFKKIKYIRYLKIIGIPIKIVNSPYNNSIFNGGKIQNDEIPY